jgi:hypothetical protein
MTTETGRLEYTGRAILQDAQTALGNDPIRGLIELITNADDAYRGASGRILIRREPVKDGFVDAITVYDHARGMTREEFKAKLMKLGAENQEFLSGDVVRGNLGRGAKDGIAFGGVLFRSIRDGLYNELLLEAPDITRLEPSRPAEAIDYTALRLGDGQNGLAASLLFTQATVTRIRPAGTLIERLANEAQLRDINLSHQVIYEETSPRRVLESITPKNVDFESPLLDLQGELPGVEGSAFRLRLWKLRDRGDDNFSQCAPQGILVKGAKATYINTFFGLQSRSESRWLHGVIDCPKIDQLLRDFDREGPTPENNARLVRRDRAGLDESHPFMSSLISVVQPRLAVALDELRQEQGESQREGRELRQRLDSLTTVLRAEIRDLLEEESGSRDDGQADIFQAIPPLMDVVIGDRFSISVIAPELNERGEINFVTDEAIRLVSSDDEWRPRSNGRHSIRAYRFEASQIGSFVINLSLRGLATVVVVRVHEHRSEDAIDYSKFRFDRSRYTTRPGRTRFLEVLSPVECENISVEIVEGSGVVPASVDCLPSGDGLGFVGIVRFEATEESDTKVRAVDRRTGEEIFARVIIHEPDPFRLNDFTFTVENSEMGSLRVTTEPGQPKRIVVYGQHPANKASLGAYDAENKRFSKEATGEACRMLAELFSYELAKAILEQNALAAPDDFADAAQIMVRHGQYSARLIPYCLRILTPEE